MCSWIVRVTILLALISASGCPRISSRLEANCKLDGIWKDPSNSDYILAEFIPKERTSKHYSEIFITYIVYNGRFKGTGIYDGTNTAALVTLHRGELGKDLQGFMICHNEKLYTEGLHPYESTAIKVYDKASQLTRPCGESVEGFPETVREEKEDNSDDHTTLDGNSAAISCLCNISMCNCLSLMVIIALMIKILLH